MKSPPGVGAPQSCAVLSPLSPVRVFVFVLVLGATGPLSGTLVEQLLAEDLAAAHNDGDAVSSWTGSGGVTVTASGGDRPVFKEGVTPRGGAVVRFNDNRMATGAGSSPVGGLSQFSIAIVFKAETVGANASSQWWGNTGLVDAEEPGVTNDWGTVLDESGQVGIGSGGNDTSTFSSGASLVDGEFHAAVFTWGPDGQAVYLDDRPGVSDSASTAPRNNAGFSVGSIHTNIAGRKLSGDIAEIRFYDNALNSTEAGRVIDELQQTHLEALGPVIASFDAAEGEIFEGGSTALSWNITGVNGTLQLAIDHGAPAIPDNTAAGQVLVAPLTTTTYTLTATDSVGSRQGQVTVLVDPGIPTAHAQSVSVAQGASKVITLTGSDPNMHPGPLVYALESDPQHGLLSGGPPILTYTPFPGYFGPDQFTFNVNDGAYDSGPATVAIDVQAALAAPSDIVLSTDEIIEFTTNGSLVATLSAIDPNPGDTHTYALVNGFGDNSSFSIVSNQLRAASSFLGLIGQELLVRIRVSDGTALSLEKTFTLTVVAAPSEIVINEIHYDPVENTQKEEFIELYNPSPDAVPLGNWRLTGAVDYVFPPGTSLAGGGYLVIAEDPATVLAVFGVSALGPYTGRLTDDQRGETVRLRDFNSNVVDFVDYRVGFPWPVAAAGDGGSIELINPLLDNELGSSWRTSGSTAGPPPEPVVYLAPGSGDWHFRKGQGNNPLVDGGGRAWNESGYQEGDDNQPWTANAQTPIGYGDGDDATVLSDMQDNYSTVYLRHEFTVTDPVPPLLTLRLYIDDGCIAYLNGNEVARPFVDGNPKNYNSFTGVGDHERSWESFTISAAQAGLVAGANTLAIHAVNATLGSSDLSVDAELRTPDAGGAFARPTPGAQNSVFALNAAPNIRQVNHDPRTPDPGAPGKIVSGMPVVITAKVSDPDGVRSVVLEYQVVAPGSFEPAEFAVPVSTLNSNADTPRVENSDFSAPGRWATLPMVDNGTGDDAVAGDDYFTATIPGRAHRTLVRYRIVVEDDASVPLSARVPYPDDPSLNFAYFVYDGVPDYFASNSAQGGSRTYRAADLTGIPVYHLITRRDDMRECMAYSGGDQMSGNGNPARRVYNWEAALVYDGKVYDHIRYRLRGANGRYHGAGKRSMKFRFNKGNHFEARGLDGKKYRNPWRILTVSKQFSNRGVGNFGLVDSINNKLWDMVGTPAPRTHWFHFRVIDAAGEAPDQYGGDFWGFFLAVERYDSRFIDEHALGRGNLYKLSDSVGGWQNQIRYQAPEATTGGQDYNNIESNLNSGRNEQWVRDHANIGRWTYWSAVKEAVRHYDYWPSANKNMVYYFEPEYLPGNGGFGKLWLLPYDVDDTWGPVWNSGIERIKDSVGNKPAILLEEKNAVREFRDLLWQRDQIDPMIDELAGHVEEIHPADRDRWRNAPAAEGSEDWGTLAAKVADMKRYAWTGGSWPGGSVGAGGRAAYLDSYANDGAIPNTPSASYIGTGNFPNDVKTTELSFRSSAFSDPQGNTTFGAMEWRVAEVGVDGEGTLHFEWEADWESGELTSYQSTIEIPPGAMRPNHTYRIRVRHRDNTGRWSHWSAPLQLTAVQPDIQVFTDNLAITEVMYHPAAATPTELADGFTASDFEFLEMKNIGTEVIDLRDLAFTSGVDFVFGGSAIEQLAPGAYLLVVAKRAAFESRYGAGLPVAGEWDRNDSLNNAGESIELTFGADTPVHLFTYGDDHPWPESADGDGYSLTLRLPEGRPPLNAPSSWRPSRGTGGSPGTDDALHLADWMAVHGISDLTLDDDLDGDDNLLEHVFGTDPKSPANPAKPLVSLVEEAGEEHLALTLTLPYTTDDVLLTFEVSGDLLVWHSTPLDVTQLGTPVNNGDGTYTITYRDLTPLLNSDRRFLRLRAEVKAP